MYIYKLLTLLNLLTNPLTTNALNLLTNPSINLLLNLLHVCVCVCVCVFIVCVSYMYTHTHTPAATRPMVSRAEERPPPDEALKPYFIW